MAAADLFKTWRQHPWRWLAVAVVAGMGLAFGLIGLGGLATVEFGLFNTTSTKPHSPIVGWATHATFKHATRLRAQAVSPPAAFTPQQIQAGFSQYVADCEMCHGGPGVPRAAWVRGMTPTPPFLLDAARQWTPAQLFWIVGRGVKMTGMPAWSETRSDAEVWDIVAFLDALPDLSPSDYAQMKVSLPQGRQPPVPQMP